MPLGTFLNGGTITTLRGLASMALDDVGKVGTVTITSDSGGGGTAVWNFGSDVPCRIDPLAGDESVAAERLSDRSTHSVTLPPFTAVATANRFSITNRGTFEVTAVRYATDEMLRTVEVVQVT